MIALDVADANRTHGVSVIAVLQGNESRAMLLALIGPVLQGDLEGCFHCARAVGGKHGMAQPRRGNARQLFGQPDRRRMRHPTQERVLELRSLSLNCLH